MFLAPSAYSLSFVCSYKSAWESEENKTIFGDAMEGPTPMYFLVCSILAFFTIYLLMVFLSTAIKGEGDAWLGEEEDGETGRGGSNVVFCVFINVALD